MAETKIGMKLKEETKDIEKICEPLTESIKHEFDKGIEQIDVAEMKEAIDMLKDLCEAKKSIVEACYYKYIMEAMEKEEEEGGERESDEGRMYYRGQPRSETSGRYMRRGDGRRGYDEKMPMHEEDVEHMRDMDRNTHGRMYYTDMGGQHSSHMQRDEREGRSGEARRGYMESKEMHKGNSSEEKQKKMKELEKYMNELSSDITEMISDASPEEKNMLKAKLTTLSSKIS